jgi:TM2 domain-containing membrane protein YozV
MNSFCEKYRCVVFVGALLLFFFLSSESKAQSGLERQYNFADSLFSSGNYFDAVTEFKRLLFFDEQNKYAFDANYKIALSYKAGAYFENAIKYFTLAKNNSNEKEKIWESEIQIIRCNILRKKNEQTLKMIRELEKGNLTDEKNAELNYWRGWSFMLADKWDSAYVYFSLTDEGKELTEFSKTVIDEKYSVTFAKVISYFLPGAGQIYAGRYVSGLLSLGWNALFGYFTINAFVSDRIFDGIAVGALLWLRFYRGNIQNAEKFAVENNVEIANNMLEFIQNNYKGRKP